VVVFEDRVLGRLFERRREEVAWGWRRLNNEKLYNLYATTNNIRAIRKDEVDGTCSAHRRAE
jgi:hypothetical protein